MIGMVVYAPIATKKRAAYWRCLLLWTEMRIAKPVIQTANENIANPNLCRVLSEKYAMIIQKTKAQAHGGTE